MIEKAGAEKIPEVGVVVIGRNEGERLRSCLLSLRDCAFRVYVDSGSTDGSQKIAEDLGFAVIELEVPPSFTAARARNTGFQYLMTVYPKLDYIQMVDGDCEILPNWLVEAREALLKEDDVASVFGGLRERYPGASFYNWLCDDEWKVPVGNVKSCGGIAMFRVSALSQAGGYAGDLIAGEEPELCLRLRRLGWRIKRIEPDMALHDAAILRFGQWWRRSQRAGHTYAELVVRHGLQGEPTWRRQLQSTLFWTMLMSSSGLATGLGIWMQIGNLMLIGGIGFGFVALQITRVAIKRVKEGIGPSHAARWAFLNMSAKIAELQGVVRFFVHRWRGKKSTLIEHKVADRNLKF